MHYVYTEVYSVIFIGNLHSEEKIVSKMIYYFGYVLLWLMFFFFFFEKNKSRGKKISLFNLYPVFYPITQVVTLGTSTFIKKTEDDNAVNENTLENAIFKSLKTCSANGIFYLIGILVFNQCYFRCTFSISENRIETTTTKTH